MRLRLRQIALVAEKLEPIVDDFRSVLGLEVCYRDPGVERFGLENALFPVGNQFLEVVAPTQPGTAGGRYLERRGGDGGYMVITQCDDHSPRRKRVEELGIRIVTQFRTDHFSNMQLHPKDTGGSFFEIDQQLGADGWNEDGPWEPAGGGDWKKAQRLDRVTAITAAEIQSPDPTATAARWSDIAQIPMTLDDDGNAQIRLDDSVLRFVAPSDGRGEGLGGIDVRAANRGAILEAARARGSARSEGLVELCGLRINLV